jgi:hypothetical protein
VILQRRIDDAVTGATTPDDFAPAVWDEWNAKSPRHRADDALRADRAFMDRLDELSDDDADRIHITAGPMTFGLVEFIGLRLNEHVLHTWDVRVALRADAVLPADAVALVVDNLELIGTYTAKATGTTRTIAVATSDPERQFTIALTTDNAAFTPDAPPAAGHTTLHVPAEAFIRLVYGRLDADHSPAVDDPETLDELRRVFPGP